MPVDRRSLRATLQKTRSALESNEVSLPLTNAKPTNGQHKADCDSTPGGPARRKHARYSIRISRKGKGKGILTKDAAVQVGESILEAPAAPTSEAARRERLVRHLTSPAVQLKLPGQVSEEPARLSADEVKQVFIAHVPGVEEFLYRQQYGNYALKYAIMAYENGVYKFKGTELEDHFKWLMRIILHYAEEGKPGARGYMQEVAEAFMDCQDIQARAIEHVGFQIRGLTLDFRGLAVQMTDEYKAMAMKFLVTTEIDARGGPDDWLNDPVHFENRIAADIGESLGLNEGDIRRAMLDEHKERNPPLKEKIRDEYASKFRAFFDLDVMLRAFVNELNSFSESSPKESLPSLFLGWVSERIPEKHVIFDEDTLTKVDIDCAFGLAVLEVLFLGESKALDTFRGKRICDLFIPEK